MFSGSAEVHANHTKLPVAGAGKVVLAASNDVNITSVTEDNLSDTATRSASGNAFKRSSSSRTEYSATTQVVGSSVSGGGIVVLAGNDIAIGASQLVATEGLVLGAGSNLRITSAESTNTEHHTAEEKRAGFPWAWAAQATARKCKTRPPIRPP